MVEVAPGAKRLNALSEGGASNDRLLAYQERVSKVLRDGGRSQGEVDAFWGFPPPTPKQHGSMVQWAKDNVDFALDELIGEDVAGVRPAVGDVVKNAFIHGGQTSVGGLLLGKAVGREVPTTARDPTSIVGEIVSGVAQVGADLPIMVPSAIGGAIAAIPAVPTLGPLAPVAGAGAAALFVPTYMREALIDGYNNGSYSGPVDYFQRVWDIFIASAKQGVVGATALTAGGLQTGVVRTVGAEVIAFGAMGELIENRVPTARSFVVAAGTIVGLKASGAAGKKAVGDFEAFARSQHTQRVQKKLEMVYKKTGKQPDQVLDDMITDPTIAEDLLSSNVEIPRAYREEGKSEEPTTRLGPGTVVDGKLPTDVVEAYKDLGDQQRGAPEAAMLEYQKENPGLTSVILEDAGDLSHRMSHMAEYGSAGKDEVSEKVPRLLRRLKRESLQEGGPDALEANNATTAKARGIDPAEHTATIDAALKKYAQAHARLPVYNEAQWLAREVAVAVGEKRNADAIAHLERLDEITKSETYDQQAFAYERHEDGSLKKYVPPEDAPTAKLDGRKPVEEEEVKEGEKPKKAPEPEIPARNQAQPSRTAEAIANFEKRAEEAGEAVERGEFDVEQARDLILSKISFGKTKRKINIVETMHTIYEEAVDSMHPLARLVDELAAGKELDPSADPLKGARVSVAAASRAQMALDIEQRNSAGVVVGRALNKILGPIRGDAKLTANFRAYAIAKRAIEIEAREKVSGQDPRVAAKVVNELKNQKVGKGDQTYEQMFREYVKFNDNNFQILVDEGMVSTEAAKKIRELNKDYIPWHRLMDEDVPGQLGGGFKTRVPLHELKGSERNVIDPLESTIKNTYLFTQLAVRNSVGRKLADLAESNPQAMNGVMFRVPNVARAFKLQESELAPLAERIAQDFGIKVSPEELTIFRTARQTAKEGQEITIYREGKREVWKVPNDVARVFNALDKESVGLLIRILAVPAKTLRAGAILTPEFTGRNVYRDTFFAAIVSKSGFVPGWDTLLGLGNILTKSEVYRDWLHAGGAQATIVSMDRQYFSSGAKEVLRKPSMTRSVANSVIHPIEILRAFSELGENATRVGEARKAQKQLRRQRKKGKIKLTDEDIRIEAAFRSREVTDFARMGSKMRAANILVAFLNARIQGEARFFRAMKDNPAKTTFLATATITLPTLMLHLANRTDPRWADIPAWEKVAFWHIMTEDNIFKLPRTHTPGFIFGSLPEAVLDKFLSDNPKMMDNVFDSFNLSQFLGSVMPQVGTPFLEATDNYSLYRSRPLVPERLMSRLPERRYTEYTSELTKAMGRLVQSFPGMRHSNLAAPIVIDNFVTQWTGGLGRHMVNLADAVLREGGVLPDPVKPTTPMSQWPFVKAFMTTQPSSNTAAITEFYDRFEEKKQIFNSYMDAMKEGNEVAAARFYDMDPSALAQMTDIRTTLSEMRGVIRIYENSKSMGEDEKRELIDRMFVLMNNTAKRGNQVMDTLEDAMGGDAVNEVFQTPSVRDLEPVRQLEALPDRPRPTPGKPQERQEVGAAIVPVVDTPGPQEPAAAPAVATPGPPEPPTPGKTRENWLPKGHKDYDAAYDGWDLVEIKANLSVPGLLNPGTLATTDMLINAQIRQESGGRAGAISSADAIGILQVLPSTARDPGLKGVTPMTGTDAEIRAKLKDPKINLAWGRSYMNALMHRYGGNVFHALYAYQTGFGTVDKWLKAGSNVNKMKKEARKYVRFIGEHLADGKTPDYVSRVFNRELDN
ncbi:MAG: LPD38 domain-containing protein [Acidiferrobacterales bacterium]